MSRAAAQVRRFVSDPTYTLGRAAVATGKLGASWTSCRPARTSLAAVTAHLCQTVTTDASSRGPEMSVSRDMTDYLR